MNGRHDEILPAARKLYTSYIECNKSMSDNSWQQGYNYEISDIIDQMEMLNELHPALIIENSLRLMKKSMYAVNKEEWLHISYLLYEELKEWVLNKENIDDWIYEYHDE